MSKKEDPKVKINAKKVGKNLIVIIGKDKYVVPNVSDKELKSVQTKMLVYNKTGNPAKKQEILDIIDIATQVVNKGKDDVKAAGKLVKKAKKDEKNEIHIKKATTKKVIEKAKKVVAKKKSKIDYSRFLTVDKKGNMTMRGCESIPMPPLLVERMEKFIDNELDITPLLNFWSLCLLNPNEIARTKLFDYLERNGIMITPSGYFVTYRMVKKTDDPNEFTHAHNHEGKKLIYVPGTVCAIPRDQCDEDGTKDCSRGLHTGTPLFIGITAQKKVDLKEGVSVGEGYGKGVTTKSARSDSYGTGYDNPSQQSFDHSFGNQAIICLINPMHVVSIPDSDTRKMRSCEFYFAKLTTAEEVIDMVEKDYLIFDGDYQNFELKQLQEMLKDKVIKSYIDEKTIVGTKIRKYEEALKKQRDALKIAGDKVSSDLDLISFKMIINQRLKVVK